MSEIRFYHLLSRTQDQALPALVSKAYEQGKRILIKMPDARAVALLDKLLWTFNPNSFLPHGSAKTSKDEDIALQPIWITDKDENPNKAEILIVTHGASSDIVGDFSLCCEMFDGHDEQAVASARERWTVYKEQGFDLTYWQQDEHGGWAKK